MKETDTKPNKLANHELEALKDALEIIVQLTEALKEINKDTFKLKNKNLVSEVIHNQINKLSKGYIDLLNSKNI